MIPLVAILFGGVVWINSAQLALTKTQGQVARQSVIVSEQVTLLKARLAQSDTSVRKRAELAGMVFPKTKDVRFVRARQGQ